MTAAIQEFIKLYIDEPERIQTILVSFLLLYVNAGFYLVDLYRLMKRKSKAETFSVMAIPGAFVIISLAMAAVFIHVPNPLSNASPTGFTHLVEVTMLPQTNLSLLPVALLYPILWGIGLLRQKGREHGSRRRWVLSCIPDYIALLLLISGVLFHLLCWEDILNDILRYADSGNWRLLYASYGLWICIWMYAIYVLVCKEAVLFAGFLSELLLARIHLRYHSGQNASAFVTFYFLFCQNAVLRGVFLMESMLVFPLCAVIIKEMPAAGGRIFQEVHFVLFLLVAMVFVVLTVIYPIMRTLACFDAWGERRQMRELFCTEYFLLQPIAKNRVFTVTYHFIIDEKDAAGVYYIPLLTKISGWIFLKNKKEKVKQLTFADGRTLELTEHEMESAKEMLSYAANRLSVSESAGEPEAAHRQCDAPGTVVGWNPFLNSAGTAYQKVYKFFMILMILLFLFFSRLF